jgi:hypothetical protein
VCDGQLHYVYYRCELHSYARVPHDEAAACKHTYHRPRLTRTSCCARMGHMQVNDSGLT